MSTSEPNQFVVSEVSGLAPGRALDVACGEGRNALWLAEIGWKVTALDYSPVAIEKARVRSAEVGADIDWQGRIDPKLEECLNELLA